ncbi:MAG: hypothetical protein AAB514_01850, partial [Patescibacteria group bacterium]
MRGVKRRFTVHKYGEMFGVFDGNAILRNFAYKKDADNYANMMEKQEDKERMEYRLMQARVGIRGLLSGRYL